MEKWLANALYIGLIVGVIVFMILTINFMYSEGRSCGKNPFIYGANKMGNVECSCIQYKSSCPALFSFNDTSFETQVNRCQIENRDTFSFPKIINGS